MGATRKRRAVGIACILLALTTSPAARPSSASDSDPLPRSELIRDVRQLSDLLESAHPDPYLYGGGKVAFHRRLQALIRSLPDAGLSRGEFRATLQPFVAQLGDGHTTLVLDEGERDSSNPGGVPLFFEVVEGLLYVDAVTSEQELPLIGATLESIEGVTLSQLVDRESTRQGHDNEHHVLSALARDGALYYAGSLHRLVPEWKDRSSIEVTLRNAAGELRAHTLLSAAEVEYPLLRRDTKIDLPGEPRWLGYHFLDPHRGVAYLWIHNMTTYREMFEYSRSVGSPGYEGWARKVWERSHGRPAPADLDLVIAGIASATETFQELFREMKTAGTRALIIDLRRNFGGNDLMVPIFLYFLVGFDRMVSVFEETAAIQKLSPFFAEGTEAGIDLGEVSAAARVPLKLGDYDFSLDPRFMPEASLTEAVRASYLRLFQQTPTFMSVFEPREDEAAFFPERILVLSGNGTQSSGFDLLAHLYRLGAEIVGVPASQAGNSFGNIRHFVLPYSQLEGYVSTKYFVHFADEAPIGFTLAPHHLLTYRRLVDFDFDPNASLLLALETLGLETGRDSSRRP